MFVSVIVFSDEKNKFNFPVKRSNLLSIRWLGLGADPSDTDINEVGLLRLSEGIMINLL